MERSKWVREGGWRADFGGATAVGNSVEVLMFNYVLNV